MPGWDAVDLPHEQLPPVQHVQQWIEWCRQLEKQGDLAQVARRRDHTKKMLRADLDLNRTQLFKQLANRLPSPAGYLSEDTHRHMITHPEEIHGQLHHRWVKGIFRRYDHKAIPSGTHSSKNTSLCWALSKKGHRLPPVAADQLSDRARWRGGTHGLDGWRYRELRLLSRSTWE